MHILIKLGRAELGVQRAPLATAMARGRHPTALARGRRPTVLAGCRRRRAWLEP